MSYDPSKTLDATTKEGQTKFMSIKKSAIEGKTFASMKESNDAVKDAMIANGYNSLIGWIDQDVKDAGRELVIYESAQPTETGGEKSSINDDMAEYTKLVEQNNGAQPKTFTVGNRTWTLNKFQNYDWSDPTTGQIYMRNVNMETGLSEEEAGMNEPVDPALIEQSLNYIDSNRKLLALDHKFADMGYDINDIIRDLIEAKTMQDYFNVKEKLDKLC